MNDYDRWKTEEPIDDRFDGVCAYCGEPVPQGKQFCDKNCKKGYESDMD